MERVTDIYEYLQEIAPTEIKMDFDNVGFLVGESQTEVQKILVALDITNDVIHEAMNIGAQLIVSHHPVFFSLKQVNDREPTGQKITQMLSNHISAICMHTNLDAAQGGVNDILAKTVGIENPEFLTIDGYDSNGKPYGIGRIGMLKAEMPLMKYLPYIKTQLHANGLRYWDAGRPVKKVAVLGGSGGNAMEDVLAKKCDTFITADIKYDVFLRAREAGINLIDADHFCTENVIIPILAQKLQDKFSTIKVQVSQKHNQTAKFFDK